MNEHLSTTCSEKTLRATCKREKHRKQGVRYVICDLKLYNENA